MRKLPLTFVITIALAAVCTFAQEKHGPDEKHKLGRKPVGDYTVSVILIGEVEAGKPVTFDIKLIDAKSDPKAASRLDRRRRRKGCNEGRRQEGSDDLQGQDRRAQPDPSGCDALGRTRN